MDLLSLESDDDSPIMKSTLRGLRKIDQPSSAVQTQSALVEDDNKKAVMFPFRIKHLGKATYTLLANSALDRHNWCLKIISAKESHASALYAQNSEPFKLKVIRDFEFGYRISEIQEKIIPIKGTPLDRALRERDTIDPIHGDSPTISHERVNCATKFNSNKFPTHVAIGTDDGVYISESTTFESSLV
jgi:hypothetical protein